LRATNKQRRAGCGCGLKALDFRTAQLARGFERRVAAAAPQRTSVELDCVLARANDNSSRVIDHVVLMPGALPLFCGAGQQCPLRYTDIESKVRV
jgi:hypothetical protein